MVTMTLTCPFSVLLVWSNGKWLTRYHLVCIVGEQRYGFWLSAAFRTHCICWPSISSSSTALRRLSDGCDFQMSSFFLISNEQFLFIEKSWVRVSKWGLTLMGCTPVCGHCQSSGSRRLEAALLPYPITCEHPPRGESAPACGCCWPWCRGRKGNRLERHWLALCRSEADLFLLQNFYMPRLLNCTISFFINPMKMHSDSTFYVSQESASQGSQ